MSNIQQRVRRLEARRLQWVEDVRHLVNSGQVTAAELIPLYGLETFTLWPDLFPYPTEQQRARATKAQTALDAAKPERDAIAALAGPYATWQDVIAAGIHLGYIAVDDVRAGWPDTAENMIRKAQQYVC